ncbi:cysteine and histidine-rich domain-containing protein 1-like [Centruroides sculpturatus]|uniref:cysteine and histidine-rich domain-containing protein 1-like n=1 Tax=Centruroides sculpturatus TaxID=218467 RepID=UPI000C6CD720|nr:cysteine and histidine-rich domain-containing protein 1-like [Centruroides sculpturatus]
MANVQEDLLQCYNRGCGQRYDPDKNKEDSCIFHPGVPVFHDAYKSWSCCNRKTTDFTEFLNIKGCTKSFHNNVKPAEPEKPKIEKSNNDEVYKYEAPKYQNLQPMERPSENLTMVKLASTVGSSLKPLLDKIKDPVKESENKAGVDGTSIPIGTSCKNGGCKQSYEGEMSNATVCNYHPGVPIFHEGLKYWSCCTRKTTDFETFLEQEGCTTGSHTWIKKKESQVSCRYDWHQTGSQVVVSVYSKLPDPDLSCIDANPVKLSIHIVFGEEKSVFDLHLLLCGVIDVEKSKVSYLSSKVEINLRKAEPISWRKLFLENKLPEKQNNDSGATEETVDNEDDDDLDDIIS